LECFREEFAALDLKHYVMITLDSKNRTIGYHTISIGSLATSIVHPREAYWCEGQVTVPCTVACVPVISNDLHFRC